MIFQLVYHVTVLHVDELNLSPFTEICHLEVDDLLQLPLILNARFAFNVEHVGTWAHFREVLDAGIEDELAEVGVEGRDARYIAALDIGPVIAEKRAGEGHWAEGRVWDHARLTIDHVSPIVVINPDVNVRLIAIKTFYVRARVQVGHCPRLYGVVVGEVDEARLEIDVNDPVNVIIVSILDVQVLAEVAARSFTGPKRRSFRRRQHIVIENFELEGTAEVVPTAF